MTADDVPASFGAPLRGFALSRVGFLLPFMTTRIADLSLTALLREPVPLLAAMRTAFPAVTLSARLVL